MAGQMSLVRPRWFEPHMDGSTTAPRCAPAIAKAGRIAQQFATREQFLTEMALDPPQATGDLAGPPYWMKTISCFPPFIPQAEWDAVYCSTWRTASFRRSSHRARRSN